MSAQTPVVSTPAVPGTPAPDVAATPGGARRRRGTRAVLVTVAMAVVAVFWFSPLALVAITALRTSTDFFANGALALPQEWTIGNFARAWGTGTFSTVYANSLLITVVKVPIGVLVSALLAYALAKMRMRLRKTVMYTVLLGLTIPIYITIVPLFTLLREMGLTNNLWGLLGPYLAFGIPFQVLILQAFFRRVPHEVIEAAHVDGAGQWRIFFQIVVPLSVPALVTVAVLDAVATWNEFLMALVILTSSANHTIPVGLLAFQGQFATDQTGLAAGVMIAVAPILLAYAFLQRYIVGGLTAGAVKG